MSPEAFGLLSGILVVLPGIPYIARIRQGVIQPNITSWTLWTIIGFVLLVTYRSAGAEANVWPAFFAFLDPLVITVFIFRRQREWTRPSPVETLCLALGLFALGVWAVVRGSPELSQYALYLAIAADSCATIPTVVHVWKHPDSDRPFAWVCVGCGYGMAFFAITDHTIANYALPLYFVSGATVIAIPLIRHRLRTRAPLSEWI